MSTSVRFIHADSHRACIGCATAKTKCVPSSDGTTTCERCTRLKRECVIVAKLDRKRKRTSCNRQAALEEKVEEIAAQVGREPKRKDRGTSESTLPAVKDETPGLVTIAPKSASAPAAPAPATVKPAEKEAPLSALSASSASSVGGTPMASRSASLPAAPFQDIGIGDDECAEALARFMNEQSDHCPWVQLPKGTTAPGLRDQKPLLFLGIMLAASYHDFDVQQKICKTALHYVSDQLIVHGNKSIALLQGLLVLLNWYQSQFLNPQATVTNLLHLSIALTTDLGLNQNPTSLANQRLLQHSLMSFMNGGRRGGVQSSEQMGGAGGAGGKSMEDRRALVGTFYISMGIVFNSSPTSSHAMGWSPMLEEAAQALHESGLAGNRADLRLAKMCRLQQINAEIDQVQRELTLADKPLPSLALYIKPFEVRLEQFWLDMPLDFRKDDSFLLSYNATYRNLYKLSLLDIGRSSDPSSISTTSTSTSTSTTTTAPSHPSSSSAAATSSGGGPAPDTLATIALQETRHRCLRSALGCMDVFFAVPPARLFAMPLVFYAQVGLAMITLARLMFSVPNPWTPDLPPMHGILDRLARNLDMAMDASALAEGKDVRNTRLAQWAAWVRILEGAVMADASTGAGGVAAAAQAMGGAAAVAQAMGGAAAVASLVGGDAGDVGGRGIAPTVGALYNTPPMERGSGDPAAAAAAMTALASGTAGLGGGGGMGGMIQPEPELLETDWTALLDDMCGYGLFGYSDDGALQGVLNGYDGTVTM